jgi:hypothetical protein
MAEAGTVILYARRRLRKRSTHDKYFEFVVLINDDPFGKNKLSDKFAEFLAC